MVLEEGVLGEAAHKDGRAPAVVYVVVSHDNPPQIVRLVKRIRRDDPDGHVVLQHDAARCPLDTGELEGDPHVHLMLANEPRRWGRYSITQALLDALRFALEALDFDWLTVISGQDYPTQPLSRFKQQLARAPYDAFVSAEPVPAPGALSREPNERYLQARYYFRWYELPRSLLGWATRSPAGLRLVRGAQRRVSFIQPFIFVWTLPRGSGDMIGLRRRHLPFGARFRCYKGSVWMTLSRHAAETVTRFVGMQPEVASYYERTVFSAESLLVTIVCNSDRLRVSRDNHHFCQMSGPGNAHASILRLQNLDQIRGCGKPFARKFDDRVDAAILDALDARLDRGE